MDPEIVKLGYKCCSADTCVYIYHENHITIFVVIYVDDFILLRNNTQSMYKHGEILGKHFKM
jgi:hypothetical protein